jgi:NAD(P)H-flavin reductase
MGHAIGRVSEIRFGSGRHMEACITCPDSAVPSAGQYLLAFVQDDASVVLGTPLFTAEKSKQGFWAVPLFPSDWEPGTKLNLVGPLGHGFDLPRHIQRLGMVALGETVSRLLPLVHQAAQTHAGMALFTDLSFPTLPVALEVHPLASLKDSLDWPDFMALDVPLERLPEFRARLDLPDRAGLACPAQVLITTPMPCAGMAQCGACAVLTSGGGWKLVCEDGPVFDLNILVW